LTAEVLIPCLDDLVLALAYELQNLAHLLAVEPVDFGEAHWLQPQLGIAIARKKR